MPNTPTEPAAGDLTTARQHRLPQAEANAAVRGPLPPRRLHSQGLFAGETEIEIEHQRQIYRLRKTALGKLILTK